MTDKQVKLLRFIHSKLSFWMYNEKSQFRVGKSFTSIDTIATTRTFRQFEKEDVCEAIILLSKYHPDMYELSSDKKYLRVPPNHPMAIANSVLS